MRLPQSSMTDQFRELPRTFQNPLIARGADPWFVKDQDTYYFSHVQHEGPHDGTVYVRKSRTITGMRTAEAVPAVTVTDGLHPELWAPELHRLPVKVGREWQQKWYLYVSAADPSGAHRRVYVYEAQTPDPQGPYREKGKICDLDDYWGIDGTVLRHPRGNMYFLWSGEAPEVPGQQNLYIAQMQNPWTLTGRGICISKPEFAWERVGPAPVNEGPATLVRDDRIHVIYAASHSLTDDYCLGRLTLRKDADPLDPEAWQKAPTPVFCRTDAVFGPGHPSFTTSPDGQQDFIVYHSARYAGAGWQRQVNVQPFTWGSDGTPQFGRPVASGEPLPLPSGEYEVLVQEHGTLPRLPPRAA
jgi:GH43 family beta-xylosidase